MAKVEVYSADYCPYCTKAKMLLTNKGVEFTEHDLTGDNQARIALVERSNGMKTIPQIFIDGAHYGGFTDIEKLNKSGELDKILAG